VNHNRPWKRVPTEAATHEADMSSRKPNILLLFTDQQRADTIAALGNPIIKTPAMDRLAREGTAFTRCYTPSPVCIPARCSLVTGLPPHITGCVDNQRMPQDRPSFMEKLRKLGYQTHGVGKMHFSPDPFRMWGFETRDTSEEMPGANDDYFEFLKHRNRRRPFFLWSSFIKPHPPFESPTPWNKLYRCAGMPPPFRPDGFERLLTHWNHFQNRYKYRDGGYDRLLQKTIRAAYYPCISFIDFQIGRILDSLGADLYNTLILFTSDHGELLGDYGSFGKRCMLDAAARVPLIARWPKVFPAGSRCAAPATLLDLWPTFLAAAGAAKISAHREGIDLRALLAKPRCREAVFSQFQQGALGMYMATDERWKYTWSAPDQKEFLFDLKKDPQETKPVRGPQIGRMREKLIRRFRGDHYSLPLTGGSWKKFPKAKLPEGPDAGLLFQDPADHRERLASLGEYARSNG